MNKLLIVHGSAKAAGQRWPWPDDTLQASVRHLESSDLPACIAAADCIAVDAACGTLQAAWPQALQLLAVSNVPMLAFEPATGLALWALSQSGTCVHTLQSDSGIEVRCRAHLGALQRVAVAMHDGRERITRFVFQGN